MHIACLGYDKRVPAFERSGTYLFHMEGKSDNDQALAPPMRVQETASGIAETHMEAVATRTILKLVVAELSKISIGWYACYEIFAVFRQNL